MIPNNLVLLSLLWLRLLGLLRGNSLDGRVFVLGSDLNGSLGLGLDKVDSVGQRLGRSLSSLGVVRLHADFCQLDDLCDAKRR